MRRNSLRVTCVTARNRVWLCGLPYSQRVPIRPTWAVTSLVGLLRRTARCPLILLTTLSLKAAPSLATHCACRPSATPYSAAICCDSSAGAHTTRQTGDHLTLRSSRSGISHGRPAHAHHHNAADTDEATYRVRYPSAPGARRMRRPPAVRLVLGSKSPNSQPRPSSRRPRRRRWESQI